MTKKTLNSPSKVSLQDTVGLPLIESAGGLVRNNNNQILLMFKRGKWDMPKGRIEQNQCREDAALREVEEEVGLDADCLEIQGKLVSTFHTTSHSGVKYLKKTHWYLMNYTGDEPTMPQVAEGIIECRWVNLSDLPSYRELLRARINYVVEFWHKNFAYAPRN